jgi:hypothetical protein
MRVSPVILALLLVARSNLINSSADQGVPEVEGHATSVEQEAWMASVLSRTAPECSGLMWQSKTESKTDAILLFERTYTPGDCLVFYPTGQILRGIPYGGVYIGFGGYFNSSEPLGESVNSPGDSLIYVADTPRPLVLLRSRGKLSKQLGALEIVVPD